MHQSSSITVIPPVSCQVACTGHILTQGGFVHCWHCDGM
jgi:hypothetical protein